MFGKKKYWNLFDAKWRTSVIEIPQTIKDMAILFLVCNVKKYKFQVGDHR